MIFKALTLIGFCAAVLIGAGALDGTRFSLAADSPLMHTYEKAAAKTEAHPEIRVALTDLRQAMTRLQAGDQDSNARRLAALKATQAAIAECEAALKAEKK